MEHIIPKKDREVACHMREDVERNRYAWMREAGVGWRGGFLVYTKAGYRKRLRVKHVPHEETAIRMVNAFIDIVE